MKHVLAPLICASLSACILQRDPPCATGYERDSSGECVDIDTDADKVQADCTPIAIQSANFGCEGPDVVVTTLMDCVTTGDSLVNLFETSVTDGRYEEHDLTRWDVDPTGTWEQLDIVLEPTGTYARNLTTSFDCVDMGNPLTAVIRTYSSSGALVDCALLSTDPAGEAQVFGGTAPGQADVTNADELTAANCATL